MKGLIIYKGKYGATEQYATWLSEALKLPALQPGQVPPDQLAATDLIILGTSIYIGKFQIRDWLQQNAASMGGKKLFLFVVSGTPLQEKDKLESYIAANVPAEIRDKTRVFFLPGKLNYSGLSWMDKILLRMGAFFTNDAIQKKRMLTDYNDVRKDHLSALIKAAASFGQTNPETSQPTY
jgi:menaquinone-dependent protoporphyrinogen IX oxidase